MKKEYSVDVYDYGRFAIKVEFRYKWLAWLFHVILNKSINQAGVRNY